MVRYWLISDQSGIIALDFKLILHNTLDCLTRIFALHVFWEHTLLMADTTILSFIDAILFSVSCTSNWRKHVAKVVNRIYKNKCNLRESNSQLCTLTPTSIIREWTRYAMSLQHMVERHEWIGEQTRTVFPTYVRTKRLIPRNQFAWLSCLCLEPPASSTWTPEWSVETTIRRPKVNGALVKQFNVKIRSNLRKYAEIWSLSMSESSAR